MKKYNHERTKFFLIDWSVPFYKEEIFNEPKEALTFSEIIAICREEGVNANFISADGSIEGYATADGDYDLVRRIEVEDDE